MIIISMKDEFKESCAIRDSLLFYRLGMLKTNNLPISTLSYLDHKIFISVLQKA